MELAKQGQRLKTELSKKTHKISFFLFQLSFFCLSLFSIDATATGGAKSPTGSVGALADNITDSFSSLTQLITATAYIGGVGFFIASIFKFKQHKDSPQQTSIGVPIALLFIAAALLFLPSVVETTGTTVFGASPTTAGPHGYTPS